MRQLNFPRDLKKIDSFLEQRFAGRDYFAFVYGSYAHGMQRPESDLDIIICARKLKPGDISACVKFVMDFHKEHHLGLDFEIRHESKLAIDYRFLKEAAEGKGFLNEAGEFFIPPIIKTPEYLHSRSLLLRFFLDSLAHKHIFFSGDKSQYQKTRSFSVENLVRIILNAKKKREVALEELILDFIYNGTDTGDFYLGFENKPHQKTYLENIFNSLLSDLARRQQLIKIGDNYKFEDCWLRERPIFKI